MADEDAPVVEQVWDALDPSGETRALITETVDRGPGLASWLGRLGLDVEGAFADMSRRGAEYRHLVDAIAASVQVLGPRGWGSTMYMQSDVVTEAVALAAANRGDEADELLARQWEGEGAWRLKRVCDRVSVMGVGDEESRRLFRERARLLTLAREHHAAGRYDASIPILAAQMEGLTIDVTAGSHFFSKRTSLKADLVDPTDVVSIAAALNVLQATYGADVKETQTEGSLSRHGVLHGRELAYDTRVNSAKTWSVMDSLVQWALPRARAVAEQRRAERQATTAGSDELDERGRRVDDRERSETRDALRLLAGSAMGWHRQPGRFRDDLVGVVYSPADFEKRGLPREHDIRQRIRRDGQEVLDWRRTVSGWVLGIAITSQERGWGEYLYSASAEPPGLATEQGPGWAPLYETPAEWT